MWMAQTTASGMTPWFHWLGGKPQDLRWREPGRAFFEWIAQNQQHFVNGSSIANVAVVFAQRTNAFYKVPGQGEVIDYLQGMYQVLLQGRFFFDFVHEDDLNPDVLSKYSAIILANAALLSDKQCQQLSDYVNRGGSILATFQTGFYDEDGKARSECGLSDIFGIQRNGNIVGPNGNSSYAHIERNHPILEGFSDITLLPFAEHYMPLRAISNPVLTVLPPYPAFPPEMIYPRVTHTDEPAVVLVERGASRLVFLPGDIDHSYWRSQDPDLSRLLINAIRWMCPRAPLTVEGNGVAEVFAWRTKAGFSIHLLNYGNPELLRGWFSEIYPLGPQKVRMTLPAGFKVKNVHLLAAGTQVPITTSPNAVEFTIPQVRDYEVAAIT